ncbi:MAG TPA: hypothetical protein V6D02_15340 [Candidatus Obscuribacterales bacterium]
MRSHRPRKLLGALLGLTLGGCSLTQAQVPPRSIPLHQDWALQPGSEVAGFQVVGSLGDVSIDLRGKSIKAPFDGEVQPAEHDCIAFSSPEIPAYLFRLCGVTRPRLGRVTAGTAIGKAEVLQFAALRRQPDGTWAMVEPAVDILERTVGKQ